MQPQCLTASAKDSLGQRTLVAPLTPVGLLLHLTLIFIIKFIIIIRVTVNPLFHPKMKELKGFRAYAHLIFRVTTSIRSMKKEYAGWAGAIASIVHSQGWRAYGSPSQGGGYFIALTHPYVPENLPIDPGIDGWHRLSLEDLLDFIGDEPLDNAIKLNDPAALPTIQLPHPH
ncbi:hypothetical protein H261_07311 [Paramagnetospirillum caucaseum]|uniref:Uncharacterized protein n=1 Tax=Paramagnetospirillum caucaseum TaxID=1244869 RepID=M2YCI7_9PROT|nr:hypothetical protein H261_07311 [Paramagnetospirillum caucaseum]